ncbi:hypothetical protein BJ994_001324 [Arthrobacter pigmenti]|uniref:AbiEi antitoxin C-terminal domain-containing protein n=1 Tax=Arthrobacter pigmenti TaxID=271432 RepID=A0A846RGA8_9MICC|nr:hypothetical protein [Arthrobacter pigmenti]NJC22248.1 hypothetical protein [Arthrobacter pigmenti]
MSLTQGQPLPVRYPPRRNLAVNSTGGVLFHGGTLFSEVELQAMQLDGLMVHVCGNSYVRTDQPATPAIRAQSAINVVPRALQHRVALARQSAAWVYGCAPAPAIVSLVTDHRRRTTALPPFSDAVMHQVTLGPCDLHAIGGVDVTSPLRTALDTAIHGQDDWAVEALRRISSMPELRCPLELVILSLESSARVPGKARALSRLREALRC